MTTRSVLRASALGACAVLVSSAVAQANPATPMPAIESAAGQLCGVITANPTENGVVDGLEGLDGRGLDDMDYALTMITAIHHVCPQYEALIINVAGSAAAEELCTKPM